MVYYNNSSLQGGPGAAVSAAAADHQLLRSDRHSTRQTLHFLKKFRLCFVKLMNKLCEQNEFEHFVVATYIFAV